MRRKSIKKQASARHTLSTPKPESELEADFLKLFNSYKLPPPVLQYVFHPNRLWRFDFAWPKALLAVEVQGVSSTQHPVTGPMHNSIHRMGQDYEKHNTALLFHWRILYFLSHDILPKNVPQTINYIRTLLSSVYPELTNLPRTSTSSKSSQLHDTRINPDNPTGAWSPLVEATRRRLNPQTNMGDNT